MNRSSTFELGLVAVVAAGLLLAGCVAPTAGGKPPAASPVKPPPTRMSDSGGGSPEVLDLRPWPEDAFWLQVAPGGLALYVYPSLKAMVTGVDLVVVGRAQAVLPGRPLPDQDKSNGYGLGTIRFVVEDVLAGKPAEPNPNVLLVQFVMGDRRLLPRYTGRIPTERVVLFLANLGEHAERIGQDPNGPGLGYEYYSIQGPQGYLREVQGTMIPPAGVEDEWLKSLQGRPFDAVLDEIRALGQRRAGIQPSALTHKA